MDMGEEKELGLIAAWGFQELYVFLLVIFYVVIYGYWFATCVRLVWFEMNEHIYLIRDLGVVSSWEDKVLYWQAKTRR
jgi:hypothetical protein